MPLCGGTDKNALVSCVAERGCVVFSVAHCRTEAAVHTGTATGQGPNHGDIIHSFPASRTYSLKHTARDLAWS